MKRLTYDFELGGEHCWQVEGADNLECREVCERQEDNGCKTCPIAKAFDRLAAIKDILGEEYELAQIGKVIHCKDCVHMWAEAEFPGECYCRMLGEVVPFDGFCHRGKATLKAREQDA